MLQHLVKRAGFGDLDRRQQPLESEVQHLAIERSSATRMRMRHHSR
jgi:hypothetical protein